jgi:CheY-like chemotaxis protein/glycine cleavage system H lipoate-binding protein
MVVPTIVIITIIVFIAVDLLLRLALNRVRTERLRKERELALDRALKLDVSDEAPTLKRVTLDKPEARILAVDDEPAILDSFRKVLVLGGYNVDTVENGNEALGLIRDRDYDFVFTDLKMPGMNGVELTRAVKHLRPDIDVVVITGFATIDTAVETVRAGAMDYVEKPFTEDELLAFVRKALIQRQERLDRGRKPTIRLVRAGMKANGSGLELDVPAGVFVSPQHAWVQLALNGMVRTGVDDLLRKVFGPPDAIELPATGQQVRRGQTLFTLRYGDHTTPIPAPVSGRVMAVNKEHDEHPEWLSVKPFELSWLCEMEPDHLGAELGDLKIGRDAVDWYQAELERYGQLADGMPGQRTGERSENDKRNLQLLIRFSEPLTSTWAVAPRSSGR